MGFRHRELDVFGKSIDWALSVNASVRNIPREWRWLADQLRRAAGSIALNIAEGAAEPSPREQSRFLRMARRSAAECDAAVLLLSRARVLPESFAKSAATTLNQISAMLTGLIRRTDTMATRRHSPQHPAT